MAKHKKFSSHFFRLILPHTLQNRSLALPRDFVKKHGKSLDKYAHLQLPTGAESKMELKICNNRAWLQQGWPDFVDKYSIQLHYFLVFRYKCKSRFSVRIYDPTTSEIEYPVIKEEPLSDEDENIANQSRKIVAFRSSNLRFTVPMRPAYVSANAHLYIPSDPARSPIFKERNNNDIQLKLNGRTWCMKYSIGTPPRCRVSFHLGWCTFSRENHLQDGDICTFDLVNAEPIVFKVYVSRISDEKVDKRIADFTKRKNKSVPCLPSGMKESDEESRAIKRAKDYECNESSFKVLMRKPNVQDWFRLRIPNAHHSRYLVGQHGKQAFLHGLDDEAWPVSVYVGKEARFSSGWKDFVLDNNLKPGDACVFELLSQLQNHYKVTIFRNAEPN